MINTAPEHNECYLYLNVIQIATPNFLLFERETNLSAESGTGTGTGDGRTGVWRNAMESHGMLLRCRLAADP